MIKMKITSRQRLCIGLLAALVLSTLGTMPAQQLDAESVIHEVDAAVKARFEAVAGYTVTEHYAVYRSGDEIHPVAEMTVKTTYKQDSGKNYIIIKLNQ
jgi:hypothetical protein